MQAHFGGHRSPSQSGSPQGTDSRNHLGLHWPPPPATACSAHSHLAPCMSCSFCHTTQHGPQSRGTSACMLRPVMSCCLNAMQHCLSSATACSQTVPRRSGRASRPSPARPRSGSCTGSSARSAAAPASARTSLGGLPRSRRCLRRVTTAS